MTKGLKFLATFTFLIGCIAYLNLSTFLPLSNRSWWQWPVALPDDNRAPGNCTFPRQPFSFPEMDSRLAEKPDKLNCTGSKEGYELLFDIDYNNLTIFGVNVLNSTRWKNCCYIQTSSSDDSFCFPLSNGTIVIPEQVEFLSVYCDDIIEKSRKMVQAFALTPMKKKVEDEMIRPSNEARVNVVVYVLDTVSRMNLLRTAPILHEYLVKNLSASWFERHNRVGDDSFENMVPLFTGQTKKEVDEGCAKSLYFDTCPFIWKEFAEAGYRTIYGEDVIYLSIFFFNYVGFHKPPTDYFLMPFVSKLHRQIDHEPHCYGPQLSNQFLLNYIKAAASMMGKNRRPYFQFIHSTGLTHAALWRPAFAEKPLMDLLLWMQREGSLNNTVFVFMSDHGQRNMPLPEDRTESNLPFLYFIFPPWFAVKYPRAVKNLRDNRKRLTTHYDTRQTLFDLMNLESVADDAIIQREQKPPVASRGISLFLPIPLNRNCKTADIPLHVCSCVEEDGKPLKVDLSSDPTILEGAAFIVTELNSIIKDHEDCKVWTLEKALWAKLRPSNHDDTNNNGPTSFYEIGVMAQPAHATFEAIVGHHKESGQWSLTMSIIRRSRYGNQSYCVGRRVKPFCFCNDYVGIRLM